jgi:predicted O-methyltransferase YrrM
VQSIKLPLLNVLQAIRLAWQRKLPFDVSSLIARESVSQHLPFRMSKDPSFWQAVSRLVTPWQIPDGTGGVNPGDRRAIAYLVRDFRPKHVLEIGTHVGASTIHLTAALHETRTGQFDEASSIDSVDIRDVNDSQSCPWLAYGGTASPLEMIEQMKVQTEVTFHVSDSLQFLKRSRKKYDLIFLDGDHSAVRVYQEISAALPLLRMGGVILLHDYYPSGQSLWPGHAPIRGPFHAVQRIQREGNPVTVWPLGELQWETKLQSHLTSLALLVRASVD